LKKITKEIKYLEPASLGKVIAAIVFGITSLLLIPIFFIIIKTSIINKHFDFKSLYVLFTLVVHPVLGYILGVIIANIYNLFSKKFGGLEIILED
jgi:hypothetical protein